MQTTPEKEKNNKVIFFILVIKPKIHKKKESKTNNYKKKLSMIQEGHHRPVSALFLLIKDMSFTKHKTYLTLNIY